MSRAESAPIAEQVSVPRQPEWRVPIEVEIALTFTWTTGVGGGGAVVVGAVVVGAVVGVAVSRSPSSSQPLRT